jgi:beta-phosphoglucomutase
LPKAVLFDYDGVLVDSMSYHVRAWQIVFKDFHIDIEPSVVLLAEGARSIELAREVLAENDITLAEDKLVAFVDKKQQRYREITKARFSADAEKLILKIKDNGMRVGVVSGGARTDIEHLVPPRIFEILDVMVTGDDVAIGKPDPEGYLSGADKLGVLPEDCLVIENAPFGIQAAKLAGMKVVAITTTLPRRHLAGADFYATDLVEVQNQWRSIFETESAKSPLAQKVV